MGIFNRSTVVPDAIKNSGEFKDIYSDKSESLQKISEPNTKPVIKHVSIDNRKIYDKYTNHNATHSHEQVSFNDLVDMAKNPQEVPKGSAMCIAVQQSGYKTKEAVVDHNLMISGWTDFDEGNHSVDQIEKKLSGIGIELALIYSSARSQRFDPETLIQFGKRYRALFPFKDAVDIETWTRFQKAVLNLIGGDPCATKITQILYAPNNPELTDERGTRHYEYSVLSGEPLDIDNLPEPIAKEFERLKQEAINQQPVSNRLQVVKRSLPADKRKVLDALDHINPNCDYYRWLSVLMALYHEYEGSDEGFQLAYNWSAKSADHSISEEELQKKWDSFKTGMKDGVTIGTLFHYASEEGWVVKKSFLEVKDTVKDIIIINGMVDPDVWCKEMLDAELSPTETEIIVTELAERTGGSKRVLNAELKAHKSKVVAELKIQQIEAARGNRVQILYNTFDMNLTMHRVEAAMLQVPGQYELLHSGSFYIRVKVTKPTGFHAIDAVNQSAPDTAIFYIYEPTSMLLRIEQSVQLVVEGECGLQEIPVPADFARHMTLYPEVQTPVATGLITHPITYPDGTILIKHGYDNGSSLYLHSGGVQFIDNREKVLTRRNCKRLLKNLHDKLFSEFEFCDDDIDASVAMALMFTSVQRKILDISPGFVITANVQGSGKTTLARIVYVILTGSDMPVTSLSPEPTEAKKEIVTHLMEQIEMMCIDNEPDGSTLKSPTIAKMLTAPEFKGRILGYSKNATVKTNVTIVYTGNNLQVDADFVRRLLICNLEPKVERPEQRTFKHPDIVGYCRSIRKETLADITTIIRSVINS